MAIMCIPVLKITSLSSFWLNHLAVAINGNVGGLLEYLVSEQYLQYLYLFLTP